MIITKSFSEAGGGVKPAHSLRFQDFALGNFSLQGAVAFTLAEVLITIGIVGVVAALTIPNLMTSYREKATVAKVTETFSILTRAYNHAIAEYGTPEGWVDGEDNMSRPEQSADSLAKLAEFMKLSDNCIGKSQAYAKEHCYWNAGDPTMGTYVRLINGVTISHRRWSIPCVKIYYTPKNNTCGNLSVILEPFNKNTKSGVNAFTFYLTPEGIIPGGMEGMGNNSYARSFTNDCNRTKDALSSSLSNMNSCAAWVIYNKNMDYLHCDDLSWNGKHSCK